MPIIFNNDFKTKIHDEISKMDNSIQVDDEYKQFAMNLGFNLFNATRHILNSGNIDESSMLEDLKKAKWYLEREIERLENGEI